MFYRIRESLVKKVVGKYPQVVTAEYRSSVNADNFIGNVNFKKSPEDVVIPNPILQKSAKLTDLISAGIMGFNLKLLVSTKLMDILLSFRSDGLEFLPAPIIKNGDLLKNYHVLNFYENNQEFIDFPNSEIIIKQKDNDGNFSEHKIYVQSVYEMNSLLSQKKELGNNFCHINRVSIDENIVNQDFFVLKNVVGNLGYYVSEDLKNTIIEKGCTGIELIPSDMTSSEWRHRNAQ